jgi:hypothetical protein
MAISVKFSTLFGTHLEYQFESDTSIFEIKDIISKEINAQIHLYVGEKELIDGTLETNNIKNGDTVKLISDFRAGFSPVDNAVQKAQRELLQTQLIDVYNQIEDVDETIRELQERHQELQSYLPTPLEELVQIQSEREIIQDDYEREDMRILFQRCRNQIEDEGKKAEQVKKENELTKRKIDFLKNRMQKRKRQINKIFNKTDKDDKFDNVEHKFDKQKDEQKKTFGGFKKGFLLK